MPLYASPSLFAQSDTEYDAYKVRISAFWFYSNPSGSITGSDKSDIINLQKDIGFNGYGTFTGKLDWRFTRKNHLYLVGALTSIKPGTMYSLGPFVTRARPIRSAS